MTRPWAPLVMAAAAVLAYLSTRRRSGGGGVQVVPMVTRPAQLSPADVATLPRFGVICVKTGDGRRPWDIGAAVAAYRAQGLDVEGWVYAYARTVEEAVAEATAQAAHALSLGVRTLLLDVEGEWAGTSGTSQKPCTPDPAAALAAWIGTATAAGVRVVYAGLIHPTRRAYPSADCADVPLASDAALRGAVALAPQTYARTAPSLTKQWDYAFGRAATLGIPCWPIVGSGRLANGVPVPSLEALRAAVAAHRPQRVYVFVGAYGAGMLSTGNAQFPAWSSLSL